MKRDFHFFIWIGVGILTLIALFYLGAFGYSIFMLVIGGLGASAMIGKKWKDSTRKRLKKEREIEEKESRDIDEALKKQAEELREIEEKSRKAAIRESKMDEDEIKESLLDEIGKTGPMLLIIFLMGILLMALVPAYAFASSGKVCFSVEAARKIKSTISRYKSDSERLRVILEGERKRRDIMIRAMRKKFAAKIIELEQKNMILLNRRVSKLPWILVGILGITAGSLGLAYAREKKKNG